MEHENINELTNKEEACKRVKQIANVMKKLKINNYLKIGELSQEDKNALSILERDMDTIAQQNGLQKLVGEIKTNLSDRYDMGNDNKGSELTKTTDFPKILEAYRGAVDAEAQALKTGKISKARRCQSQAQKFMNSLDVDNQRRAIMYKREMFLELNLSLTNTRDNTQKWINIYQGCYRIIDASERAKIYETFKQKMKGCEKTNGKEYAGSVDRGI